MHKLLEEEVKEYNSKNPVDPITDPSDGCIGIVLLFIDWYMLYRRRYPPKDEVDIENLQALSLRYLPAYATYCTYEICSTLIALFYLFYLLNLLTLFFAAFWTSAALSFHSKIQKDVI